MHIYSELSVASLAVKVLAKQEMCNERVEVDYHECILQKLLKELGK
jgi:hypothetical protein